MLLHLLSVLFSTAANTPVQQSALKAQTLDVSHVKTSGKKTQPNKKPQISTDKCYILFQDIRKFYQLVIYLKGRYEMLPANKSLYTSSGDSLRYIIYFYGKRQKRKRLF